jgi:nitrate/TMAO reductase-like tetraheme cytochrome c subunit
MAFKMRTGYVVCVLAIVAGTSFPSAAQISPGPLATVHSKYEGMSNCTKCHTLGAKVANEKCLSCHTELKVRIDQKKGYHSSKEISGKECITCHSDHHGEKFEIIRFNKDKFDHNLTGYTLAGAHLKQECAKCHNPEFITDKAIKSKKNSYLGLNTDCLTCHADYHQKTLPSSCFTCHNFDAFKPASKFNHTTAKFQLKGKHNAVDCLKCHKIITKDGKKFQQFTGIEFNSCTNCHADVHHNQFGQNCVQCHTVESFHSIKGMNNFDHSKTGFLLEDKHIYLSCKSCHKTDVTAPVKHDRCTDCHSDYHNRQFVKQGSSMDCSDCHSTKGFENSSYTIEQHNGSNFQLQGAHLATPCLACHKKQEKWSFRNIGIRCIDCHENIHHDNINVKFYPESRCENCHTNEDWKQVQFDHSKTNFSLVGSHLTQACRSCHLRKNTNGIESLQFTGLTSECINCHIDIHNKQFEVDESTDCLRCHTPLSWDLDNFNHNSTQFKLDGKHENVACEKCHKMVTIEQKSFTLYKIKDWRCESCHL